MSKILIVEDEESIAELEKDYLELSGFEVETEKDGKAGLERVLAEKYDLLILDLMLPGISGEEVLSKIKGIPVIVISAKDSPKDKVSSLLGGAVDYISKPFDNDELLARIALRLRESVRKENVLCSKGFTLDDSSKEIKYKGHILKLTRTEYSILKQLIIMDGTTITKSSLLNKISLDTPDCTENSLKQHVSNLRKKIESVSGEVKIENIWGVGFRLI